MNKDTLEDALGAELTRLYQTENELELAMQETSARLAEVRRRRSLVEALLSNDGAVPTASAVISGTKDSADKLVTRASSGPNGRNVADIAYDILVARGKKPMHYEELAEAVIAAGGMLGGQTPSQTLVARISRDPRFVRPEKRGWYAAREFYPHKRSVGSRRAAPRSSARAKARF